MCRPEVGRIPWENEIVGSIPTIPAKLNASLGIKFSSLSVEWRECRIMLHWYMSMDSVATYTPILEALV